MKCLKTLVLSLISFVTYAQKELSLIDSSEIKYKNIAKRIAIVESGHFKSKFYKRTNNVFGFKKNSRKNYTHTSKGYCVYETPKHSVKDYMEWESKIIRNLKLNTREKFLNFVVRRYSANKQYLKLLNSVSI